MKRVAVTILACVAVAVVTFRGQQAWWWIEVHTGTVNEPGPYYGFWSGFGSDLGEATILAAVLGAYHKHNCHTKGCWRIGKHVVGGTPWCSRHHEDARGRYREIQVVPDRTADTSAQLAKLSEDISGLAEAIRLTSAGQPAARGGIPQ